MKERRQGGTATTLACATRKLFGQLLEKMYTIYAFMQNWRDKDIHLSIPKFSAEDWYTLKSGNCLNGY